MDAGLRPTEHVVVKGHVDRRGSSVGSNMGVASDLKVNNKKFHSSDSSVGVFNNSKAN